MPTYASVLSPEQEAAFRLWQQKLPTQLQSDADYDLRGAYLDNAQAAANGHMTDKFKKPNHMTFSDASQYSTPEQPGGHWEGDGKGGWIFWASPQNVLNAPINDLYKYFKEYEPDSALVIPSNFDLRNVRK